MAASRKFIRINKYNLLIYYANARKRAFTTSTIKSSFRTTGIWPFNRNIIEDEAFLPAVNTTTQSAQPDNERQLSLPPAAHSTSPPPESAISDPISPAPAPKYQLANFPAPIPPNSSRRALREHNKALQKYAHSLRAQVEGDHAQKQLMDAENGRLREQLYAKKNKPKKQRIGGAGARHMTDPENLDALACIDWKASIAGVHVALQALESFQKRREVCDMTWKDMKERQKQAEKDAAKAEKDRLKGIADEEKAELKRIADEEKARLKSIADEEKARLKRVAEEEKARLKEEKRLERVRNAEIAEAEKVRLKEEKRLEKEEKRLDKLRLKAKADEERAAQA